MANHSATKKDVRQATKRRDVTVIMVKLPVTLSVI
jgi:hypothetical protein